MARFVSSLLIPIIVLAAGSALAASDAAWEEFRKDVADKCLAAGADMFDAATADVDPFGSERFGLALLHGKAKGAETEIRVICVYDKQAKTVEIGGELPPPADQ
jgi:hypothetical protein